MVYLQSLSGKRFWNCQVNGSNVETRYGNVGYSGRVLVKYCDTPRDARAYRKEQVAKQRQQGRFCITKKRNKNVPIKKVQPVKKMSSLIEIKTLQPTKKTYHSQPRQQIKTNKEINKNEDKDKKEQENVVFWYYYLHNDPFGKSDGWYIIESEKSNKIEEMYQQQTKTCSTTDTRKNCRFSSSSIVKSNVSGYHYLIDLTNMEQINATTGTVRPICRHSTYTAETQNEVKNV